MTRAEKKVVKQRLSALQLAEALGNVSEACRRRGMSRSQFYEYKRRFQTHGVVEQILALSMEHPMWGCVRLSRQLMLKGVSVSSPTIQNILIKNGMASRYERLLKLEAWAAKEKLTLTPEQVAAIERANPCYQERHAESSRPGAL